MSRKRNKGPKTPPTRIRDYRIEAQLREEPDLHKLAQVFVSMAVARTQAEQERAADSGSGQNPGGPVES